ncbi:histidine phosphatase family protein [Aerococcaceae bacterium DSM 111176]|nr:histidine phosphatase family protein [Aerococcaceae bacterium DSM 111176]
MTRLYLMRHGQTLFNQLKRIQGACDSPLTELGQSQAVDAKDYFDGEGIEFDQLFCSTQERASDTLELIRPDADYTRLKGLKEWNFGLYEGASEYLNPPHKPDEESYGSYFKDYDGESVDEVEARMTAALTEIMDDATGNVLAVSHGGALYSFFLKWRKPEDARPSFSNCCILVYDYQDGKFDLVESVDPVVK